MVQSQENNQNLALEEKLTAELYKHLGAGPVDLLTSPTPPDWIESRTIRGGGKAKYVKAYNFPKMLNACFGLYWGYQVIDTFREGLQIVSKGRLTIKIPKTTIIRDLPDGTRETIITESMDMVKEQFGGAEVKTYSSTTKDDKGNVIHEKGDIIDLADDHKASATDALKKCCVSGLSMFSDVYSAKVAKEGEIDETQLGVIYMRGETAGMNKEETEVWIKEATGKELKDLSSLESMQLVPELMKLANEREAE